MGHRLTQAVRQRRLAQFEDGGPDVGDRGVEVIDRTLQAFVHQREVIEPARARKAHADRVDPLDDAVVEIPSNSVPVIEDAQRPHPIVQAIVLNCNPSGNGKGLCQCLVLFTESFGTDLVGQIEVAVDLVSNLERDPEKGSHRRMILGIPVAVGVLADSIQTQRHGIGDKEPEDTATGRPSADGAFLLLFQAHGQELFETGAPFVEHAESAVAGADQRTGFGDRGSEQMRQLKVTREYKDRRQQSPKLLGIVHPGVGHAASIPSDGGRPRGRSGRAVRACAAGSMDR